MALENLVGPDKFIANLVIGNPTGGDDKREGDDHLRGIKNVLKNSFPNVDGAVSGSDEDLNMLSGGRLKMPVGTLAAPSYSFGSRLDIGMWSPSTQQLGFAIGGVDALRGQIVSATGDMRWWMNDTTSRWNLTGRSQFEVNGSVSSMYALSVGGVQAGAMLVSANALTLFTPAATPVPITFSPGATERARLTATAQPELLLGATVPQFGAASRALCELNGAVEALLGLSVNGSARGSLLATAAALVLAAEGTRPILFTNNGAERARIDSDGTFKYGGSEIGWRGSPSKTQNASYTIVTGDRSMLVQMTGGTAVNLATATAFGAGDTVKVYNISGGNINLAALSGVTMRWGTGASMVTTTPRVLANNAVVDVLCVAANVYVVNGSGIT